MAKHAIEMRDGSVVIMETVGDATPDECLSKWPDDLKAKVRRHRPADPGEKPSHRKGKS